MGLMSISRVSRPNQDWTRRVRVLCHSTPPSHRPTQVRHGRSVVDALSLHVEHPPGIIHVASFLGDLVALSLLGILGTVLINWINTVLPLIIAILLICSAITCVVIVRGNNVARDLIWRGWTPFSAPWSSLQVSRVPQWPIEVQTGAQVYFRDRPYPPRSR